VDPPTKNQSLKRKIDAKAQKKQMQNSCYTFMLIWILI